MKLPGLYQRSIKAIISGKLNNISSKSLVERTGFEPSCPYKQSLQTSFITIVSYSFIKQVESVTGRYRT